MGIIKSILLVLILLRESNNHLIRLELQNLNLGFNYFERVPIQIAFAILSFALSFLKFELLPSVTIYMSLFLLCRISAMLFYKDITNYCCVMTIIISIQVVFLVFGFIFLIRK